jgi:hypothetical protein
VAGAIVTGSGDTMLTFVSLSRSSGRVVVLRGTRVSVGSVVAGSVVAGSVEPGSLGGTGRSMTGTDGVGLLPCARTEPTPSTDTTMPITSQTRPDVIAPASQWQRPR